MKKVTLIFAFVLTAQFVKAQDTTFKTDAIKVITMSGADAQMKSVKNQILKMIPIEKQNDFIKEFEDTLPSLYDKMAKVYMEIYTPDDIKAMIKYYESPVGLKISAKAGELSEKSMVAGQEWGQEFSLMMMKYKQ